MPSAADLFERKERKNIKAEVKLRPLCANLKRDQQVQIDAQNLGHILIAENTTVVKFIKELYFSLIVQHLMVLKSLRTSYSNLLWSRSCSQYGSVCDAPSCLATLCDLILYIV